LIFSEEHSALTAETEKTLLRTLGSDRSVDVRLNSARAMGQFKSPAVLNGLIAALTDSDFAVRYEAEQSLIRLTGRTFKGSAKQWLSGRAETPAPFADAGKTPPELVKPTQNVFERTQGSFHKFYEEWQGPAKE